MPRQHSLPFTQKGGRLVAGAASLEAIESSRGVLAPNQHGEMRGLQQFYTPVAATEFISWVLGSKLATIDLTAGDGSLLASVEENCRYGVEIDHDQVVNAVEQGRGYNALRGDVQQIFPMLQALGPRFKVALLNPPFGLPWSVPGLGDGGSAELTLKMGRALLAAGGIGVIICGAARFDRELRPLISEKLFAVVHVETLFQGTDVDCAIAFWREADPYTFRGEPDRCLESSVKNVAGLTRELAREIYRVQESRFGYWSGHSTYPDPYEIRVDRGAIWRAVQEEYNQRRAEKARKPNGITLAGRKLKINLSAYSTLSVVNENRDNLRWVQGFNGQPPNYFALRPREWGRLQGLCAQHSIPVSSTVSRAVESVLDAARQVTCPLYPVGRAQRLAFLVDRAEIVCKVSDESKGYIAGTVYPINCKTEVNAAKETREKETTKGPEAYAVIVERKALRIEIGQHHFDEGTEAMEYILEHFEVPDPGDLSSQFPEEVAHWTTVLQQVEREIQAREPGFRFRTFQVKDMARMLVKISRKLGGLLAWEQGLGKALAQGAIARALELSGELWDGCALFGMPQDLVPQFSAEMKRFFGVDLIPVGSTGRAAGDQPRKGMPGERSAVEVRDMVQARRAAARKVQTSARRDALSVPKVWAVTWFEALTVAGRAFEAEPPAKVQPYKHCVEEPREETSTYDRYTWEHKTIPARAGKYEWRWHTSELLCPRCGADSAGGWDGKVCRATLRGDTQLAVKRRLRAGWCAGDVRSAPKQCGYVHRQVHRKAAYSVLANVFKFASVDEGTKIQGDDSLTSKAIRAFRTPFRMLATGTPLKNYVHQMYWLLWWSLGDSTPRFPYAYNGGSEKFLNDFGVTETACDERGRKERGARPKVLPEVSNLLYLWKMLCGSVVRRRMDEVGSVVALDGTWACRECKAEHRADVGEPWTKPAMLECTKCGTVADAIVPLIFKPVEVPFGVQQKRQYQHWLDKEKFASWFLSTHPDSPLQRTPEAVKLLAASIGQIAKLEYATVDPTGDRDWQGASAWTPSRLKVLQLIEEKVRQGHRVLYGSCLVAPGRWVAERLNERGIKAVHLTELDAKSGRARTRSPKDRARAVMDFRSGKAQVLCASFNSMSLGHNLDVASVVVQEGFPWDFLTEDQFIKRTRRLTSMRPVEVYLVMPLGSLSVRKSELLQLKGDSSDLALDGKITGRIEVRLDKATVLKDLVKRGIRVDGTELLEEQVFDAWMKAA